MPVLRNHDERLRARAMKARKPPLKQQPKFKGKKVRCPICLEEESYTPGKWNMHGCNECAVPAHIACREAATRAAYSTAMDNCPCYCGHCPYDVVCPTCGTSVRMLRRWSEPPKTFPRRIGSKRTVYPVDNAEEEVPETDTEPETAADDEPPSPELFVVMFTRFSPAAAAGGAAEAE